MSITAESSGLTEGAGGWKWAAVKLGWRAVGEIGTAITAYQLTHAAWNKIQMKFIQHRAEMKQEEMWSRILIQQPHFRVEIESKGPESTKMHSRQYYQALAYLLSLGPQ